MGILARMQGLLALSRRHEFEFGDLDDRRIAWEPVTPRAGETVCLYYRGLLGEKGADDVYLHYGFDGWQDPSTLKMDQRADGVYTAEIQAEGEHRVDLCFRDAAGNWDNNDGRDWALNLY